MKADMGFYPGGNNCRHFPQLPTHFSIKLSPYQNKRQKPNSNARVSLHPVSLSAAHPNPLSTKEMDTSNPAVFVNAELLQLHVGKRVRALIQVFRSDGGLVIGKSTDNKQLNIKGHPPNDLSTFVEVIGIAEPNQSIKAEIWTNFGDVIDTGNYDSVCRLANGDHKSLFY